MIPLMKHQLSKLLLCMFAGVSQNELYLCPALTRLAYVTEEHCRPTYYCPPYTLGGGGGGRGGGLQGTGAL